jgi:hypothetical protein
MPLKANSLMSVAAAAEFLVNRFHFFGGFGNNFVK